MILRFLATISVLFLAFTANAAPLVKNLVFGDITDGNNTHFTEVKQLLVESYNQLGISIEWLSVPGERSLKYSNEGRIDGEILRVEQALVDYPNLLKVPLPIAQGNFHLYCLFSKPCKPDSYRSNIVGYNIQVKTSKLICDKLKLKCATFYNYLNLLDPLYQHKVDAYLAHDFELNKALNDKSPILFQSKTLFQVNAFHFLHKRHKDLIPIITGQIQKGQRDGSAIYTLPLTSDLKNHPKIRQVD